MPLLDNAGIRRAFPVTDHLLYFDAALQAPLCRPVRARLESFYDEAQFTAGPKGRWLARVEEVRARLAGFLGVSAHEIAFTKNTSEGLNIAACGLRWEPGDNVVLLAEEHPNNAYAWLARRPAGLEVRRIPGDKKWADAATFAPYLDERTRAVTLSHVMFHSGQRNDIAGVAELARSFGAEVIVDAMQSVGVMPVSPGQSGVTAMAAGSHKGLLLPQGMGFLYTSAPADVLAATYVAAAGVANTRTDLVAGPEPVEPRDDARRFEIGNVNLPAVHALGAALDLLEGLGLQAVSEHLLSLGDALIERLDTLGIGLVGPRAREHRSHIHVLELTAPRWPAFLAEAGVRLSPVRGGLRVSFGIYNTLDDIDRLTDILARGLRTIGSREVTRSNPQGPDSERDPVRDL